MSKHEERARQDKSESFDSKLLRKIERMAFALEVIAFSMISPKDSPETEAKLRALIVQLDAQTAAINEAVAEVKDPLQ